MESNNNTTREIVEEIADRDREPLICDDCDQEVDGLHAVESWLETGSPEWVCTDCAHGRGVDLFNDVY